MSLVSKSKQPPNKSREANKLAPTEESVSRRNSMNVLIVNISTEFFGGKE